MLSAREVDGFFRALFLGFLVTLLGAFLAGGTISWYFT